MSLLRQRIIRLHKQGYSVSLISAQLGVKEVVIHALLRGAL